MIGSFDGYSADLVKLNDIVGTLSLLPSQSISALSEADFNTLLNSTNGTGTHFKGGNNTSIAQLTDGTSKYWAIDLNGDGSFTGGTDLLINVTDSTTLTSVTVETFGVRLPTLSTISTVTDAIEDTEKEISFANLMALADEADVDGTVTAFVVKSVASGTLKIGGNPWVAGNNDVINSANIAFWTPAANANGELSAFSVVAKDNGGYESSTAIPVNVDVAAVNDAPTATNLSASEAFTEDASVFSLTDIVVTDVDSANITATLTLSNTAAGSLNVGSSNGVIPTFSSGVWSVTGAIADVNALLAGLTFTPTLNFNSNFTIATSIYDGVAAAITGSKAVTVTPISSPPVNNAPTATDTTQTFNEDTTKTFAAADFGYADVDNNLMASVKIVTLPALGLLKLGGDSVTANQVIPTASISNLTYTPVANANGTNYSNFTFTVNDGSLDSVSNNTMTLNVTPVNDAPTGSVTISRTSGLTLGSVLTAATNKIADIDGLGTGGFSYEWKANGTKITSASSSTYTLTAAEVGKVISVEVSYTDGGGTLETVVASVASYSGSQTGTQIYGTTGDDTMSFVSASNSTIIGYSGDDTISFSSTISNSTMDAGTGDDTISITGAAGNDSIITDTGNDTLSFGEVTNTTVNTGTGDDTISITGAAGYDSIITDTGNDTLSFGFGIGIVTNTTVNSGTGDDIMTFGSTVTSSTITGNEGVD